MCEKSYKIFLEHIHDQESRSMVIRHTAQYKEKMYPKGALKKNGASCKNLFVIRSLTESKVYILVNE